MTIWKHWCKVCGVRCEHQNLCEKTSCLTHARKVELAKVDLGRGWAASRESFLETRFKLNLYELTTDERALFQAVVAHKYEDISEIISRHKRAATSLKVKLINLKKPEKVIPKNEVIGEDVKRLKKGEVLYYDTTSAYPPVDQMQYLEILKNNSRYGKLGPPNNERRECRRCPMVIPKNEVIGYCYSCLEYGQKVLEIIRETGNFPSNMEGAGHTLHFIFCSVMRCNSRGTIHCIANLFEIRGVFGAAVRIRERLAVDGLDD